MTYIQDVSYMAGAGPVEVTLYTNAGRLILYKITAVHTVSPYEELDVEPDFMYAAIKEARSSMHPTHIDRTKLESGAEHLVLRPTNPTAQFSRIEITCEQVVE